MTTPTANPTDRFHLATQDRSIAAGLRQTEHVRGWLRRLGPLALPLAIVMTTPSWVLAGAIVIVGALCRHPGAVTALLLVAAAIGIGVGS